MFDLVSKGNSVKDVYCIGVVVDGAAYMYGCDSLNHGEALEMALTQHRAAGISVPVGTDCYVYGACHGPSCHCGKDRVIKYEVTAGGYYCTSDAHDREFDA
jgi:hypothetical protein